MGYHFEKTEVNTQELVFDGWEKGIAPSPEKGIGNIQNANIATENGEVMCNFGRNLLTPTLSATGTFSFSTASKLSFTGTLPQGSWISVLGGGGNGLTNGTYYVSKNDGLISLSTAYDPTAASALTSYTAGLAATWTVNVNLSKPIATATEVYYTASTTEYRYYILDQSTANPTQSLVWVYDTFYATNFGLGWTTPTTSTVTAASGIAILNGWLLVFSNGGIRCCPTVTLDGSYAAFQGAFLTGLVSTGTNSRIHNAFVGHQGKCYYTDGNYIGSIFPNTSLLTATNNVQSYGSFTTAAAGGGVTCTLSVLISGSTPTTATATPGSPRIPAAFFAATGGTKAAAITLGTLYYIAYESNGTFKVYAAISGGSALDMDTGATGTQYFNTFYPISSGGLATLTYTPQALNLPFFEVAQCMTEVSDQIYVGTLGNTVYTWNQIDVTFTDNIILPESGVACMVNVNNMAYIFAGNKGNVYISNGSAVSTVLSVPDYCAGIAGTPQSYIEPYFIWQSCMYLRGRVYCALQDQTIAKTGNCGGIWSFTPTQNLYIGQDTGLAPRLDNQNSYATYNGGTSVLIPIQQQAALGAQYFSGWYSSISSPTFGIDGTSAHPSVPAVIETELVPTGTMLNKKTDFKIEYKLAAPLVGAESITMKYRLNGTDVFTSCGSVVADSITSLSGYFVANFEKTQWLQLQATLNGITANTASFVRLKQIRVR